MSDMIEALLEERRGYVARGLTNRVAQVDEQLKALGATPPAEGVETADAAPRKKR